MLFYPDMYTIASKHMNLIAFVLDVPLLLRVLKSMSDSSDAVEVSPDDGCTGCRACTQTLRAKYDAAHGGLHRRSS
jgi:hypothetical protein